MRADLRLRSSRDFARLTRSGESVARPELVLYYSRRAGDDRPRSVPSPVARFGFVVSRRIGGAVVRNRVKRLLREAVRPLYPRLLGPVDVVVVAREPIRGLGFAEVAGALEDCAARAGLVAGLIDGREVTST